VNAEPPGIFLFRELLYRRAEFVGLVMEEIETWMNLWELSRLICCGNQATHFSASATFYAAGAGYNGKISPNWKLTRYNRTLAVLPVAAPSMRGTNS
jgi:hypothetical protein